IVATRGARSLAEDLARDIARRAWEDRARYVPRLTALEEATRLALECGRDRERPALLFADVADNPGVGGRGNTVWILEAFHKAGVEGCVLGPFFDPLLVAEAYAHGPQGRFKARFNRDETQELSGQFEAPAEVTALNA